MTKTPDKNYNWLAKFYAKLGGISALRDNWDGEGSPRPPISAIRATYRTLEIMKHRKFSAPQSIHATPDAGIAITFLSDNKHANLEFTDEISAVILLEDLKDRDAATIDQFVPSVLGIRAALDCIREYFAEEKR